MRFLAILAAIFCLQFSPAAAQQRNGHPEVDLVLVLAVDISYSMDPDEQKLQREGYIAAITSPEVIAAIGRGLVGRIAIAYVEWANSNDQQVVVPWRVIDGAPAAEAFAAELAAKPYRRAFRTSISGAINASVALLETAPFRAQRRVIDVSGDGANNNGPPVERARDAALEKRITINGLPIMLKRPNFRTMDIEELDAYYQDCVVGGPGSFVIPIKERDEFTPATRRKLLLEIAGITPSPFEPGGAAVVPVDRPRADCLVGERMWRERWERN